MVWLLCWQHQMIAFRGKLSDTPDLNSDVLSQAAHVPTHDAVFSFNNVTNWKKEAFAEPVQCCLPFMSSDLNAPSYFDVNDSGC